MVAQCEVQTLRGCYVETPYGWGICCGDDGADAPHVQVALNWRLGFQHSHGQRVRCWLRREDLRQRSFCAVGACVLTSFGAGVLIGFRAEDNVHEVQLWGPLSKGRHRAYLQRGALLRLLPAVPGLAVETNFGPGMCTGLDFVGSHSPTESLRVSWSWGRGELAFSGITCRAAMVLPLINRFLDHAASLLRLHSGTLARLADALGGAGLERLQQQLAARAGEAVSAATKIWEEWEEKETSEVISKVKSQADLAMSNPKLRGLLDAGVARLNKLVCRAQGFDGTWVGRDDSQPRCEVEDAMIRWHWGEESELEIWSTENISTRLGGEVFRAKLRSDGCLQWTDGDVWMRRGGSPVVVNEEDERLQLQEAVGELGLPVDLPQLRQSLEQMRRVALKVGIAQEAAGESQQEEEELDLDEGLQVALTALTEAAQVASSDKDVKSLVSAFQEQLQLRQDQLLEVQETLKKSKAGQVLLEGQDRLAQKLLKLQETAITPQLDMMQQRSRRLLTRLATDKKVKNKATQFFSMVQSRFSERFSEDGASQGLESWVTSVRERVMAQLGANRASLVEGLLGLQLHLEQGDLRQLVTSSWEHTASLEAQLELSLLKAVELSGFDGCSGTELLDRFESSESLSNVPVLQETSKSVLGLLSDLGLEVPSAVQHLLQAQASGRTQDAAAWHAALVGTLDDEAVVQGASGLVERGETIISHLQEIKSSQAVARVMEHLENEDMERDLLACIHDFNPEKVLSSAEGAFSSVEAREELISQLKDTCLEFILKILPAIHIDKVDGEYNGCLWEINDINFSDFSFRKEDVRVTLGDLTSPQEELLRISAWDISAHFRKLKVTVKQETFPYVQAECVADAKAERMVVGLAFRMKQVDGGAPVLVMSGRSVHMESLDLWVHETSMGSAMIVNALTFLFADVLKSYACEKISSQLDEHVAVLIDGLNYSLAASAPLLQRLGLSELLLPATRGKASLADAGSLHGFIEERRDKRRPLAELIAKDPEPSCMLPSTASGGRTQLEEIVWSDPGRSFAVRV